MIMQSISSDAPWGRIRILYETAQGCLAQRHFQELYLVLQERSILIGQWVDAHPLVDEKDRPTIERAINDTEKLLQSISFHKEELIDAINQEHMTAHMRCAYASWVR
ncbi:MAG: hypothetical protein OWR52_07945 [Acidibacillus sp.]|nr:hypothetical protein [Acidibacillus sp.]